MDLERTLFVCDSVLARLDRAMASARTEAAQASALEERLRRVLDDIAAEQVRIDCQAGSARFADENDATGLFLAARDEAVSMSELEAQMAAIKSVRGRFTLLPPRLRPSISHAGA